MEPKRLFEIYSQLKTNPPGGGQWANLCRRFAKELGVTKSDIENEKSVYKNKDSDLRHKTIKATYTKLRHHIIKFAVENRVVELGKPLPKVGAWSDGKVLLRVTDTNLLTVPQNSDSSSNMVTHRDPLNNSEFIDLLNNYRRI